MVVLLIVVLLLVGGLVLSARAAPSSGQAAALPATPGAAALPFAAQASQATGDPVSVEKDADGYTVWTYDYSAGSWCVPYSRLRWPFNLGAQDPSELSDTKLWLTFAEREYVVGGGGESLYTDPTWSVALNGKPGAWSNGAFTGEWNLIGKIVTPPTRIGKVFVTQEVPFAYDELIDGENNLWLQQHDFCPGSGAPDYACTCVQLTKLQLRASVDLAIQETTPADGTERVAVDQSQDSQIRVKFTTVISAATLNQAFQVYYFDQDVNKVYVAGKIKPISNVEYAFVPSAPLLDGVRYVAQVYGEADATAEHPQWVTDLAGGPLEQGQLWTFSTLPALQVTLDPVQVLSGMALVQGKPTALRTFVRWDTPPNVFWKSNVPNVLIDDVIVSWLPPGGTVWLQYSWSVDANWVPALNAKTARHKREYRGFTFPEESYSLLEKLSLYDSFNFFGFTPREMGVYQFKVDVIVKDNLGKEHRFPASAQGSVFVEDTTFPVYMQAVAVGSAYGQTGTVDWSAAVRDNLDRLRALYPVARVNWPAAPSAMAYYSPTTTGWTVDWVNPPSWPYYPSELYLLREMNQLCIRTTGCRVMVGLTPWNSATEVGWQHGPGTSLREEAPLGALIRADPWNAKRYTAAHEIAHLAHIDDHYEGPSGNGFDVSGPNIKNAEQGEVDFMSAYPEEVDGKSLWITNQHYTTLWQWIHGGIPPVALQRVASADPLLVVDGVITPTTDAVTLLPWYQLAPGDYVAPVPGPYKLVFLDAAQQEIVGYTRSFTASGGLAFFNFAAPYPATTAKVQIRRVADNVVLAEMTPAANAPTLTIHPPAALWHGPQPLTWDGGPSARYFAVDISTDGGVTWVAQAFNLTDPTYTLQTTAFPNTTQAMFRVAATDGLRTTTASAGPFTIDNPPLVGYTSPPDGATKVNVLTALAVGFRDAMNPDSLTTATITLTGGAFGSVAGTLHYDAATHVATFMPQAPLAYATTYTARVTTGVRDATGEALPAATTLTFTTTADMAPPSPVVLSPSDGAVNVPRNQVLAVGWDRELLASTLNAATFNLATAQGVPVIGAVSYDATARLATFTPAAPLAADTLYIATLKAGIQSTTDYTTAADFHWAFTTGRAPRPGPTLTGSYADAGMDINSDGLYEQLRLQVGVQVTATGSYALSGALVDADGAEIAWAYLTSTLTVGGHFLDLVFDGAAIGGHGVDGPYTLTDLTLVLNDAVTALPLATVSERDAYHTAAYPAARFPAPLRFTGLPDVVVTPGTTFVNAFNVRAYAHSTTRASSQLTYTVMLNTQPAAGVALQPTGEVYISPEAYWLGRAEVTVRASDGVHAVQDRFTVLVGWPHTVYLPIMLRQSSGSAPASRNGWVVWGTDSFEGESIGWSRSGWSAGPPGAPNFDLYYWGQSTCRAYSGQHSAWIAGDAIVGDTPTHPPCGTPYFNTMGTIMIAGPVNLTYVSKGEYKTQVWANLAPGDEVCLKVAAIDESGACDTNVMGTDYFHGVCRSGQTNGWETLTLDLAHVPTLGNVLGQERVCLAVIFQADKTVTRPEGAYVDDVSLRFCPQGLEAYCTP